MSDDSEPVAKKRRIELSDDSSDEEEAPECHINKLPDEILMDIFERLYFVTRKECALVCQRWYSVLRSSYFMSRTTCIINHCFGMLVDPGMQRFLSNCGTILFHDLGSIAEFDSSGMIPADKADEQPGPSRAQSGISMEGFLFSGKLPVRSFSVTGLCGRIITFVGGRLHRMPQLEEFAMHILPPQDEESTQRWVEEVDPDWTIDHPTLRALTVLLYAEPMPYTLALPQLKKLIIEIDSDNELLAVMNYSTQLEDLWVLFYFARAMEQILTYPFPVLKKLNMKRYGENDPPDPNTRVDDASAERFIRSAPLLEDVTLRFNIVTMRMLRAVCVVGERSITRLTLYDCVLPRRLLAFITELKKLEYLKLKKVALEEGDPPLRQIDLPMLRQLELINSGTCIRIDNGLSNVTHFRYTIDPKLSKVCRHMVMLEDFEIKLRTKYPVSEFVRDHFHSLPNLFQLRRLCISGMKTTNRPWDFCQPMPAVEHLILRKSHLVRCEFRKLPKLFPSLRVFELRETHIAYKRCPAGANPSRHFEARLKSFFPNCSIVMCPKSCATPLPTILLMEDEFRWHYNRLREAGIVLEPVSQKEKAKVQAMLERAEKRKAEIERMEAEDKLKGEQEDEESQ